MPTYASENYYSETAVLSGPGNLGVNGWSTAAKNTHPGLSAGNAWICNVAFSAANLTPGYTPIALSAVNYYGHPTLSAGSPVILDHKNEDWEIFFKTWSANLSGGGSQRETNSAFVDVITLSSIGGDYRFKVFGTTAALVSGTKFSSNVDILFHHKASNKQYIVQGDLCRNTLSAGPTVANGDGANCQKQQELRQVTGI